ncbi:LPXTG cell wall anchor domain protein [Streptomyces viridochromogenes]|uniref:LPXTG cell wall anchor domain protein n=1 Tax=Streptomyces viridochromogenes TaxID=1938 RepID=A0A0J8BTM1_STRVR|nr:LAETG motif-containing sortase-dependent surface protein [Streptomyces viridochromogenes]KMS68915.1 LPXTG cell wall anchor domain protein [Streptomyces viridochromogenes]KOG11418.1 LPXTG cell wall anchor domain protein [Streptomyces viridochromogenes]KOG11970.1 LPXTG cell wall anchor domain protein [Streptomyces viridochromogenes]
MSIARRVIARRLLGTGAASLALCAATVASASGAWATGSHGGDGWKSGGTYRPGTGAGTETATDRCQFSLDGSNFYDSVKVDDQNLKVTDDGKVHIKVRAAADATTCTASLASYLAHGATFETSGEQVFVDFDTVTVKPGQTDSLDIAVPDAGCFAQIDLYRGAVKFDGKLDANDGFVHGDLPKGPDRPVIKDKLIAAWNGGTKDCTTEPPATEEPPTTPPAEPPTEETTPPAEETTPPASETPTPETSEPTTPAVPKPNGGGDNLAETGGSSATGPITIGAVVLVAGGAAFVVASKRRRAARS